MNALRSALQCLVVVARHHGVDLSVERLVHEHALGDEEPDLKRLAKIAVAAGLGARRVSLGWDALRATPPASFPLLLRLENGNTVIALGFREDTAELAVADPLANKPGQILLPREKLEAAWKEIGRASCRERV